ncbi:MAG: T9SS type A sorting domain-containing protein [Ignavibacteriae bacterium]|nr:T9SS type A sorting domain-containing protein [Ignavibacteriota bacterium]
MKKVLFILAILMLISSAVTAQYIPFTNTTRIFDLDTGSVIRVFKVPLPQTGYKNFYVQRGGSYIPPYTYDLRYGNILRYIYSANGFTDSAHYRRFHSSWSFDFTYGYSLGYVLDLAFSAQDTNLFLYGYRGANWEPAEVTAVTRNNGLTVTNAYNGGFMSLSGGVAIDPVNDSIMYMTFNSGSVGGNVHKSTNRGANWFTIDTVSQSPGSNSRFFVNKFNRSTIFLSFYSYLYRSTTGGSDFQQIKTGLSDVRMLFDATDNTIYMSSNSAAGLLKSADNGTSWTTLLNKAVGDFEFDPLNSNTIYAGCTDGLYKSINKGSTWMLYNNSFMPDVNVKGIVKNPNMGDTLFVSTNKAVYKVYGPSVVDTNLTAYFPMTIGNVYVYETPSIYPPFITRQKLRITKDTVVAGKRFYYFNQALPGLWNYGNWYRIDGATGVVTGFASNYSCNYLVNERYVDSLGSRKSDSLKKCGTNQRSLCIDTTSHSIFGIPSKQKAFREDGLVLNERTYSKNFGITNVYTWEITGSNTYLVGCKINGVTYGDTLLTGVENVSAEVPSSYSLRQNYPNPFNPSTTIRYNLPRAGVVKLAVYDVMGREVEMLVNERQAAGSYEAVWDGTRFASGVYFYRLTADGYGETRKMLMIR